MERIASIVQQLQAAIDGRQDIAQLQVLSSMLQAEISALSASAQSITNSGRVAVVLPAIAPTAVEKEVAPIVHEQKVASVPEAQVEKVFEMLRVDEAELEAELEEIRQKAEFVRKVQAQPKMVPGVLFETEPDIPTLVHQPNYTPAAKEVNEAAAPQPTLNDQLASNVGELAEQLSSQPVKDLRKAIGVNDRYVYINALFRGDEDMYERSIKTINQFSIYAEAEYWIQRELKIKLGWNDADVTTAAFYALVRRRFS